MHVSYVIYADFETIIKPKNQEAGKQSEITSEHEACGFSYQVVRYDGKADKPVIYRGEYVVEVFLKHLECEVNNIKNIFAHIKPLNMTEQNNKEYESIHSYCLICDGEIKKAKCETIVTLQENTEVLHTRTAI